MPGQLWSHAIRLGTLALLGTVLIPAPGRTQVVQQNLWVANGQVNTIATSNNIVYLGGTFTQVGPATGAAVAIDASTGSPIQPCPMLVGTVKAVASDGSGGWYIGGSFNAVQGQPRRNLAQIDASGNLTSWNPSADTTVCAINWTGSSVYVAGQFTNVGGQSRNHIAELNPATGTAASWNPNANGNVLTLATRAGTIYAGGEFTSIGGQPRGFIAALDATTGNATSWNPDADNVVLALAVQALQVYPFTVTVYAGGAFTGIGGINRRNLAALDGTTGNASFSWNVGGTNDIVDALAYSGGKLYIGGYFTNTGYQGRSHIAALNAADGVTTAWDPNASDIVNVLVVSGSTVYAGGSFDNIGGQPRNFLAALDVAGAATSWNPNPNHPVDALATGGSAVYAGGEFTSVGGLSRNNIAALDATTGAATSWNPNANGVVDALLVYGSTVYAGGEFSNIGGQARNLIAALDGTTGGATSWNANMNDISLFHPQILALGLYASQFFPFTVTVYAGGYFTDIGGQSRNNIAALDGSTGTATSWNPNANSTVDALAVSVSPRGAVTVYAGGYFTSIGSQARSEIAALNANGAATAWNPNANGLVYCLALGSGVVYAGGTFGNIGTQGRNCIAALDQGTGVATAWNPNSDLGGGVYAIAVGGSAVYAGGVFTGIGGQLRNGLAALDASTGAASGWNPNPNDNSVGALAIGGTTVYAGGYFTGVSKLSRSYLVGVSAQVLGVDEPSVAVPPGILRAAPNPFRADVTLRFALPKTDQADVAIYDLAGRLVRHVHHGVLSAGEQHMSWDGRDDAHRTLDAGLYFVHVRAAGFSVSTKIFLRR